MILQKNSEGDVASRRELADAVDTVSEALPSFRGRKMLQRAGRGRAALVRAAAPADPEPLSGVRRIDRSSVLGYRALFGVGFVVLGAVTLWRVLSTRRAGLQQVAGRRCWRWS